MNNFSDPQWIAIMVMIFIQLFVAGKAWGGSTESSKELKSAIKDLKDSLKETCDKVDKHLTGADGKHHIA